MTFRTPTVMRLYTADNERLYLNAAELQRFLAAADVAPAPQRRLALTLAYTGCRLSEARMLRFGAIQPEARVISVYTLKRRQADVVREVPIPAELAALFAGDENKDEEDHLVWAQHGRPIPRITAYRWIKRLMQQADITGARACPKGLRHGYGTRAVMAGVPLHVLQRWMGHAAMQTTAIYATVLGPEQLKLADRMWV